MATSAAPTREIGTTNPTAAFQLPGWRQLGGVVDDVEKTQALRWPRSVRETYPAMRNDSQVEALFYATTLPIRRYRWMLDPNGAREEAVRKLSADLGLPILGEAAGPIPRARGRFSFGDHLRLVLLSLLGGHYFFEQYGEIAADGLFHLRKLAPRAPHTIDNIDTAPDGGLRSIRQQFGTGGVHPPNIGVERLVAYVWDQEPGGWVGRSMLRSIYREWTLKDRLLRVDTVKHERNGLGVPTAKATQPDVSPKALEHAQAIASAWRAGDHASATFPYGVDVELKGVTGNLPDTLASIERHDQAMSKRWLGMLIDLANTNNGSRALGDTHADLIELGRDAIASWVCDVFSEHVLEDDVDWNFGEGEEFCPRLTYERDPGPQPVAAPPEQDPPEPVAARARQRKPKAAAWDAPAEDARRELTAREVQAKIDVERVDRAWQDARTLLVSKVKAAQQDQIAELGDAIKASDGNLSALASLSATPRHAGVLEDAMLDMLEEGAAQVVTEAAAQGVNLDGPPLENEITGIATRAAAVDMLLARSISEAAGRQAINRTGSGLSAAEVADQVVEHLSNLSDAYLEEQLGGTLTQAMGTGRRATMRTSNPQTILASALLDAQACEACLDWDGHEFDTLAEAEHQFPTGGNAECLGGPRCRCLLVAVYDEEAPSVQ